MWGWDLQSVWQRFINELPCSWGNRECCPCGLVSLGGVLYGCRRESEHCLAHPQGSATCGDGAGGRCGSTEARPGFCAEPSFCALQITAGIGEIWGRAALGRDGCMQTFSEMVFGEDWGAPRNPENLFRHR